MSLDTKKCLICRRPNSTLHWHSGEDTGLPWVYCIGTCQRAYSIYEYTALAGLTLSEFLKNKFEFKEALPNEVQRMEWPDTFIPLFHERAKPGLDYIRGRGIEPDDGMYYDTARHGIVFPYYYDGVFVGAQIRLINPSQNEDGRKIDTLTGTRTGLLFYGWDQSPLLPHIKGIIITEGAFNSICIKQAMTSVFGGLHATPWKCISTSGSGSTRHQLDVIKEAKESGLKIVLAPDSDKAGMQMFDKYIEAGALTHYAFTENSKIDWNDISRQMSSEEFVKWFMERIKVVRA